MVSARVYAKTPAGDEAVRQSTRVVQRNLRLVLVQIDGKLSVEELTAKIGNARLVEGAIGELERGGYIVPLAEAAAAWAVGLPPETPERHSALSQFSTFGARESPRITHDEPGPASVFSAFGKPVLAASQRTAQAVKQERQQDAEDVFDAPRRLRLLPWLTGGVLALIVGALLLVFFYPYDRHRAELEKTASELLQTPVTIGAITFVALPRPHLELHDLRLGGPEGAASHLGRIGRLDLPPPWQLWASGRAQLGRLEASQVSWSLPALLMQPGVASASALALPALHEIKLNHVQLMAAPQLVFAEFNGVLSYAQGRFVRGRLENQDKSLALEINPAPGQLALRIEGRAWQPPALPLRFGALDAKATLDVQGLQVREIEASIFGGLLQGEWSLGWNEQGLAMRGDLQLARVDLQQLSSSVLPKFKWAGALEGPLRLNGSGSDWAALWSGVNLDMQATVLRGTLFGIDLGEAGRRGPGSVVRAGNTRFDRLAARVQADARGIGLHDLHLDAGAMRASGALRHTPDGQIEGRLTVDVRSSVAALRVPVRVSGMLPNPEVVIER